MLLDWIKRPRSAWLRPVVEVPLILRDIGSRIADQPALTKQVNHRPKNSMLVAPVLAKRLTQDHPQTDAMP